MQWRKALWSAGCEIVPKKLTSEISGKIKQTFLSYQKFYKIIKSCENVLSNNESSSILFYLSCLENFIINGSIEFNRM